MAARSKLSASLVRSFSSSIKFSAKTSKPVVKRTRKKTSELPETFILPSGEAAKPLPEWQGGLTGRKKASSAATTSVKRTRTPRKAKTKDVATDELISEEDSRPKTELAIEIFQNLQRFPHCILLTRVGQFYESYFEQANIVAKLLNIKLTSKPWGKKRVPFCGFPLLNLEKHLKVLIRDHQRYVALCEEFKKEDGRFERRVTRVLTPGTLIDEAFLNPYENNYILSISCPVEPANKDDPVGLAWMDVSTGEFFSQTTTLGAVRDEVVRIGPKEIVLHETLRGLDKHSVRQDLAEEDGVFISYTKGTTPATIPATETPNSDDITDLAPILPNYASDEASAISQLATFLHDNLLEHMPKLTKPLQQGAEGRMQIDAHAIKSLEIKQGMREGGTTGTLLSVINRTTTSSGSRLLSRWICSPSTSISEISTRQSIVAFFCSRTHLRADVVGLLRKIEDTARIVQKFLAGRGRPDDLRNVAAAIACWEELRERFALERKMEKVEQGDLVGWECMDALLAGMTSLKELSERISAAVSEMDDEPDLGEEAQLDPFVPTSIKPNPMGVFKWHIKPEYSPTLTRLHAKLKSLRKQRDALELEFQNKYSANSLSLRASSQSGFHVHVRKKDAAQLSSRRAFFPLTRSSSGNTFINETWFTLGSSMSEASDGIIQMERAVFRELREAVTLQAANLRKNARIIDEIDVTLGFADLAVEMNFVRPVVDDSTEYHVVNGRHPTVELGLLGAGRLFVANNVSLDTSAKLHVITGPNMAGKSTLLRQTALIAVLAQTGSFVPADSARIGIIDRLFSRVGAKDDLFRDRSTFMVEMLETAEILNRATPRSLVIMDEVGRGTSVSTALAIAFATVHHLYTRNQCRAFFATHFHEIADMLGYDETTRKAQGFFENIAFYCTDVDELEGGSFTYSHRIKPGVNRDSHGLKVAQLGGMPTSALKVAANALEYFHGSNENTWVARAEELRTLGAKLISSQ